MLFSQWFCWPAGKEGLLSPEYLSEGDQALVELTPCSPVCVESSSECPALGRFVLHAMKRTVAVGIIKVGDSTSVCFSFLLFEQAGNFPKSKSDKLGKFPNSLRVAAEH